MSSLKRKESSSGGGPSKSARTSASSKNHKDSNPDGGRPSKRAKADKATEPAAVTTPSAVTAPLVSRLKEDEPLFPRGGGSVLTPLEVKQIQVQAKRDALLDQETQGDDQAQKADKTKKKAKAKRKAEDPAKPEADGVKIESLNFKRLVKGSLVLGQVAAITPLEVTVTLPNNLVGHLALTSISQTLNERLEAEAKEDSDQEDADDADADNNNNDKEVDLNALFSIGEYIRVSVLSTEDTDPHSRIKRRIELSVRPEQANAGLTDQDVVRNNTVMASVVSEEDRGYVMDLGLENSDLRGFLPKKELDPSVPASRMQPGAVLLCLVASSGSSKVVQLTTLKKQIGNIKHTAADAVTISAFLPGTAVDVLVSDVSSKGLAGKVLGHLDATADVIHSGAGASDVDVDLDDKYKIASKVKARVICTFPAADAPKIGVSLLPHITALEPQTVASDRTDRTATDRQTPLEALPLSSTVDTCTVRRVEPTVGLWVDVGVPGVSGFVHISRVKDGKVDALYASSGPYKVGSVHPGRVVGYNSIDGTYLVSFEQSVLDQPYLRIEDVPVGKVVHGTVQKMLISPNGVSGLIVQIADGVTGLVPEMHLADVKLQHPEKKFREGIKVKARVLSTDPSKKQLRLTLKKSLVNSDLPIVQSFADVARGRKCVGTIVNVTPTGAFVQFYGELRGFLPVEDMSEAPITNPADHFRPGQVVSVHIRKFNEARNHLFVSCKDPSAFGIDKKLALQGLEPGTLVAGKVAAQHDDGLQIELELASASGLVAFLPVGHLSDRSPAKNAALLKRFRVGQTLAELLVLDKHEGRRAITLSRKESLVAASKNGELLTHIDKAKVDHVVACFVRNITPSAVFVQFAAHLVALLPKQLMPLNTQTKANFGMHLLQSLCVRIVSVDNERLVVSLFSEEKKKKKPAKDKDHTEDVDDASVSPLVVKPVDSSLKTLDDIRVGILTKAKVTGVKATQLNVQLAENVAGRVDMTEVFDSWSDIPDPKSPLKHFLLGQVLSVRVLGVHDARKRVYMPITQDNSSSRTVFELSAKPSNVRASSAPEAVAIDRIEPESTWIGFVNNRKSNCLWVSLSPNVRGRLYGMETSNDLSLIKDLAGNFPIGTAIPVRVLRVDAEKGRIDLSAKSADAQDEIDWSTLGKNMVLPAKVTRVSDRQVVVQISSTVSGPVHLIDIADDYDQGVTTPFFKNDIIRVSVVSVEGAIKKARLSTRPSRVLNSSLAVEDPEITSVSDVKPGQIIRGFVRSVADKGLFVNLGGDVTAMVRIADLSDGYIKDWKAHFQVDQLVRGRVVSVSEELNQVQMSLKASVVDDSYVPLRTLADFGKDQIVTGRVRKVEEFGAFIVLDNTANVSGLCHRTEMADKPVRDARKLYKEGDVVKAKILGINAENGRINLGLKPAYFDDEEEEEEEDAMSIDESDDGARLDESDESDGLDSDMLDDSILIKGTDNDLEEEEEEEEEDDDDDDDDEGGATTTATTTATAGLSTGGFDWSGADLDKDMDGAASDSDEDDEDASGKAKKKKKTARVDVDRTAELDISGPQNASDFERLLLGQPDSSALWIAYMAFQLRVGELALAREVAERAIKTINVREETERLNVWVAFLNLEVAYGTAETADAVFRRACQYNDQREVCERAASIYIQSGQLGKADELFQTMTKKFGAQSPQIWINYAHFLHHSVRDAERARALLPRAMQMLDGKQHVGLMARIAALEFRSPVGSQERGRTVFEGLLAKSPKKFDLWDQLLDLETSVFAADKAKAAKAGKTNKAGKSAKADASVVRDVFERGARVKGIKPRRAKTWFQRWAKWEEQHGDAKSREKVSTKAKEWAMEAEKKKAEAEADSE